MCFWPAGVEGRGGGDGWRAGMDEARDVISDWMDEGKTGSTRYPDGQRHILGDMQRRQDDVERNVLHSSDTGTPGYVTSEQSVD